jgi:hypothetical protein
MTQTFTNVTPKEKEGVTHHKAAAPKVRSWRRVGNESTPSGRQSQTVTFSKAPQREQRIAKSDERAAQKRERQAAKAERVAAQRGTERETAEVSPEETEAADTKPTTRKKKGSASQGASSPQEG